MGRTTEGTPDQGDRCVEVNHERVYRQKRLSDPHSTLVSENLLTEPSQGLYIVPIYK